MEALHTQWRGLRALLLVIAAGVVALQRWRSRAKRCNPAALPGWGAERPSEHHITVYRDSDRVYRAFRQLHDLPRFMPFLTTVIEEPPGKLHGTARLPDGTEVEWGAQLTADHPGRFISWNSAPATEVEMRGSVRFDPLPGDRGTLLTLTMRFAGSPAAAVLDRLARRGAKRSLRAFKQSVEAEEIPVRAAPPNRRSEPPTRRDDGGPPPGRDPVTDRRPSPADDDLVDQMIEDSFPASDPPAPRGGV
jgi:uncharacterized membrane protein